MTITTRFIVFEPLHKITQETILFTKSLIKHFLTFSLFAVLLLPVISGSGSALAKKRPTATPTPKPAKHVKKTATKKSVVKPVIKAVPSTCLDVSGTTTSNGVIVSTVPPNAPGLAVQFTVNFDVQNNCSSTVGSIVISGSVEGICTGGGVSLGQLVAFTVNGNLASGQHIGDSGQKYQASCVIYTANVPTSSVLPTSISIPMSAKGLDANGSPVGSLTKPLTVTW